MAALVRIVARQRPDSARSREGPRARAAVQRGQRVQVQQAGVVTLSETDNMAARA